MQKMTKTDYLPNAKLAVHKNSAHTDLVGVEKINPEQNKITLKNGRTVEYGHLVIGAG
jgi:NADH dehydrogenase FAD-containing subunit